MKAPISVAHMEMMRGSLSEGGTAGSSFTGTDGGQCIAWWDGRTRVYRGHTTWTGHNYRHSVMDTSYNPPDIWGGKTKGPYCKSYTDLLTGKIQVYSTP